MRVRIHIHGHAKRDGELLLLIAAKGMAEPKWVKRAKLKAADDGGELIYNSTRPIARTVTMAKALAGKLGVDTKAVEG